MSGTTPSPGSPEDRSSVKGDLFEDRPTDLVAYLRRYNDRYTRDAMAARLIEAGHDADVVEQALAELAVEAPPVATGDDHEGARLVTRAIVVSAVLLLAGILLAGGMRGPGVVGFTVVTVGLAALVAAGATWWIGKVDSVAAMATIAVLTILLGLPVALFGGCVAYLNTGGSLFG